MRIEAALAARDEGHLARRLPINATHCIPPPPTPNVQARERLTIVDVHTPVRLAIIEIAVHAIDCCMFEGGFT
jgi:hypothetical protein